jgi:hypothetical protein
MIATLPAAAGSDRSPAARQLDLLEYGSPQELAVLLRQLDVHSRANGLRVVIVLDEQFCGDLSALVRRNCPAYRLVITSSANSLSGAAEAQRLEGRSWRQIVIEQGIEQSIRREISETRLSERLVLFWPNWR